MKECLVTYTDIAGCNAWTLWDSGSTADAVTPAFCQVAEVPVFNLTEPYVVQLGMLGSKSSINYGTETTISMGGYSGEQYLDVANLDRYDMVLGTPFMRKNKVNLDFNNSCVIVNGVSIPATKVFAPNTDDRIRRSRAVEKKRQE
jgi:hypothetical protein